MGKMMKERICINRDGRKLFRTVWRDVTRPVGVIQIVGDDATAQHDDFAQYMNRNGYIVSATDAYDAACAFDALVDDEIAVMQFLGRRYNLPLFLFGHSYGGFVAQSILARDNTDATAACTTCTLRPPVLGAVAGCAMAWVGQKIWGANAPAHTMNWITGNRHRHHTHAFYHTLFRHLMRVQSGARYTRPLLMIDCACDIGRIGGLAGRVGNSARYDDATMKNITMIIYPDAGRDMLGNMNYAGACRDVLRFFNAAGR